MMKIIRYSIILTAMFVVTLTSGAIAQEQQAQQVQEETVQQENAVQKEEVPKSEIMSSVLFTFWEHSAIADAKRSRGHARPPTEAEIDAAIASNPNADRVKPPPEERDITLGGIVFVKNNDWTIWLNGKRVTPDALPTEIIDLRVYDEYIELKWYDDWTNQIFPLRMRAHQRFNIDTRIFLPG